LAAAGRDLDALEAAEPALTMSKRGVRILCEMAASYARLGNKEAARLLQQTLDEEGKTDKLLTQLAESSINIEAARPN